MGGVQMDCVWDCGNDGVIIRLRLEEDLVLGLKGCRLDSRSDVQCSNIPKSSSLMEIELDGLFRLTFSLFDSVTVLAALLGEPV